MQSTKNQQISRFDKYLYTEYRVYINHIKQYNLFSCIKKTVFYPILLVEKLPFNERIESSRHSL